MSSSSLHINKKTYNPHLQGWKFITILCPHDVCKKKKGKVKCILRDEGMANQKLESFDQKVMLKMYFTSKNKE